VTKLEAILAGDGRSFEEIGAARAKEIEKPDAKHGRRPDSADARRMTASGADQAQSNLRPQGGDHD
jgi:hypothetical protein